jgi:hypothetical protein
VAVVGDPLVGATEHQALHELLEDNSIRYARPMAAGWVIGLRLWWQRRELLLDGLDDVCADSRHEHVPTLGTFNNSPYDGTSRARTLCATDPYQRKPLVAICITIRLVLWQECFKQRNSELAPLGEQWRERG